MRKSYILTFTALLTLFLEGCASTTSYTPGSQGVQYGPRIAVFPFRGPAGDQVSDMLAQQLLEKGYNIIDTPRVNQAILLAGFDPQQTSSSARSKILAALGADYLFDGTISEIGGPLYSYAHANITARITDVHSGRILWIGKYGNPLWSSAISTQGDIQRGASHLAIEFNKTYGPTIKTNH